MRLVGETTPAMRLAVLRGDPPADAFVAWSSEVGLQVALAELERGLAGETTVGPARDLVEAMRPPGWVRRRRNERATGLVQRHGLAVLAVFKGMSLPLSYANPAANKPLVATGRLDGDARKRLDETARFTFLVAQPGNLEFGAPGHRSCAQVRVMHALVRARLEPGWDREALGLPINQWDMAFTSLLFGLVILDGLRLLGVRVSADEGESLMELAATFSALLGVEQLSRTEDEGRRLYALYRRSSAAPDEDARRLTRALFESSPPVTRALFQAVCVEGLGPLSAELGVEPTLALPLARTWAAISETAGRVLPRTLAGAHNALVDAMLRSPPPSASS